MSIYDQFFTFFKSKRREDILSLTRGRHCSSLGGVCVLLAHVVDYMEWHSDDTNIKPQWWKYLTPYGHIKTAEQPAIIQQYGDWYTSCYICYSEARPPSPLIAVPNVAAHPSTASVPTSL